MKRIKRGSLYAVLAALLATASLASASGNTYYRWSDERGNPVHSDRPPPKGVDYEVVSTNSRLVRKVSSEEGAVPAETDPGPNPSNKSEQYEKKNPAAIKKNPEFCQQAQENLDTLESAARVRIRDDAGGAKSKTPFSSPSETPTRSSRSGNSRVRS